MVLESRLFSLFAGGSGDVEIWRAGASGVGAGGADVEASLEASFIPSSVGGSAGPGGASIPTLCV